MSTQSTASVPSRTTQRFAPLSGPLDKPIEHLRITFWGVQGSCPVFPRNQQVAEYARQVAVHTLSRALADVAGKLKEGGRGVEEMVGGALKAESIEAYQQQIGLPELPVYGGETTCVMVESAEGDVIFIDGGSGMRPAAREVLTRWPEDRPRVIHFFGSHEHLDHRSGLPFSQFCFARPQTFAIHIHGTHGFLTALDERFGIYSREIGRYTHVDDPLDFRMMAASFTGTELRDGEHPDWEPGADGRGGGTYWQVRDAREPIRVGGVTVTPFEAYHGATRCLAYKLEHGGKRFVFCTDHEVRHGPEGDDTPAAADDPRNKQSRSAERRLREHCNDADVAYFDGQYFRNEYDGKVGIGISPALPRVDWGHGCIEDCVDRVIQCRIKRAYIGHHDPERDWADQVRIDRQLATLSGGEAYHIELAKAGDVIDL
jgi:phosphoribosyl 1,2-cyclic phosphodiesterase